MAALSGSHFLFDGSYGEKLTMKSTSYLNDRNKKCSKCGIVKPVEEFNFRYRDKGVRHSYCRECGKALTRSHYKRKKHSYLKRNLRAYAERRQIVLEAKSRPCADCGVQYPYYVMDFDHRDGGSKEFALNSIQRVTKRAVLREMTKCDVVCSNCHRERTHRRMVLSRRVK
jgi:hypothetical protein